MIFEISGLGLVNLPWITRDNHLMRNVRLIIQNGGMFISVKQNTKNISVKNQKEREKLVCENM